MGVLGRFFFAVFFLAILIVPLANANDANATPVTAPFIVIDPIGNHAIGDVFYINGTTNLPVTENLMMDITTEFRMAMKNSPPRTYLDVGVNDIPVISSSSGNPEINHWSANITDTVKKLVNDKYCVSVRSSRNNSIVDGCVFFSLVPSTNITTTSPQTTIQTPSQTQPTTPFITIDPIGNHPAGDVFFINGTTNLPVTENLTMQISNYHLQMKTSQEYTYRDFEVNNIPVISRSSENPGINHWSVNVTDMLKESTNDKYCAGVSSQNYSILTGCQYFIVFTPTNITPSPILQMTIQSLSSIQSTPSQTTVPSTTQSSSLPVALPIVALFIMAVLEFVLKER
jgi:hypothetical protein